MADRLFLFDDDDTDTEVTPFRFTGQRGLSVEDYEGGRVNFGSQFLQLPDLEAQTGIDVDPDEDITELAEPAKREKDDDPSDVLSGTLNVPLFGGAEGQVQKGTEVTFYDDFKINTTGGIFNSYSDYLKSESQLADRVNLVQNLIEPIFTDREMQFGEAVKKTSEQTGKKIGEEVAETPTRMERLIKGELTAEDSAKLTGGAMALAGAAGVAGSTFIGGKTVRNAFGKDSFRPAGLLGFAADMVHSIQYDHLKQIRAVRAANFPVFDPALGRMVAPKGVDTGFAMTIGNLGITRAPGGGTYTGNTQGMSINQLVALEAISKGYDPGNSAGTNAFNSAKFGTVEEQGGMFISGNKMAGFFRPNGSFYDPRFGTSGAYSTQKQAETAAETAGVTYDQFQNALAQARSGKVTLQQALTSIKAAAAPKPKPVKPVTTVPQMNLSDQPSGDDKQPPPSTGRQDDESDGGFTPGGTGSGRTDYQGAGGGGGFSMGSDFTASERESLNLGAGAFRSGGRVGLAMGGAPSVASGFVDRPPDQVPEDQTVADNRPTQLPEGAFVINAAAAEFMGTSDVRKMLIDAHEEALRRGIVVDKRGNGAKLIDVAISSGEVVVAPHLAKIIGYDRLNKINNRGMAETRERIRENDQQPVGIAEGGFIPQPTSKPGLIERRKDEALADVELRADLEEFIRDDQLARLGWNLYTSGELMVAGFPTPFDYTRVTEGEGKDAKETVRDKRLYLIGGTHTPIPGRNTRPLYEGSDKIVETRTSINQREEIAERLNKIGVEPSAEIPIISYFAEPQFIPKYARSDPERYMGDKATVMLSLAHELRHAALNYLHFEHDAPRLSLEREERMMDYFDDKARNQVSEKNALVSAESPYEIMQARGVVARYTSKNKEQAELFNELATKILKERGVPPVAQPKEKGYISKFLDNLFN